MARIDLVQGDITRFEADAIANAANSRLAGGGGVDGAIHRAGGPAIMEACRKIGGCPTGSAVATTAGDLPAKFVFHTVGPVYTGSPRDAELLRSCYTRCLELCGENGVRTIAFPSISTGVYGYPVEEAATIALKAVDDFVEKNPDVVERVTFVLFGDRNHAAFVAARTKGETA